MTDEQKRWMQMGACLAAALFGKDPGNIGWMSFVSASVIEDGPVTVQTMTTLSDETLAVLDVSSRNFQARVLRANAYAARCFADSIEVAGPETKPVDKTLN